MERVTRVHVWVVVVVVCVMPILLLDVLTFSWPARPWVVLLFSKAIFISTAQNQKVVKFLGHFLDCLISSCKQKRHPLISQIHADLQS